MFTQAIRQPILDREQCLYAYELTFRENNEHLFREHQGNTADSEQQLVTYLEQSLPDLTAGKPAHINFDLKSILRRYPELTPVKQVVIEVGGIEKPGKRLLEEFKRLKSAGYQILLDNYVHQKLWLHFFPYIEMIKLDLQTASHQEIKLLTKIKEKFNHIKLIASKIESQEEFLLVKAAGFDYFQGYFFSRSQEVKNKSIAVNDYSLAELLFEISNNVLNVELVTDSFKSDVNLTYKLLRYSNSAMFNRPVKLSSIKQAVVSLGKEELIKFVTIMFAAKNTEKKSTELLAMALFRAKFCEELAVMSGLKSDSGVAFLAGMFSLIDVMLDEPIEIVVDKLKLGEEMSNALLLQKGELWQFIAVAKSFESGEWRKSELLTNTINITIEDAVYCYRRASSWSDEQMSFIK